MIRDKISGDRLAGDSLAPLGSGTLEPPLAVFTENSFEGHLLLARQARLLLEPPVCRQLFYPAYSCSQSSPVAPAPRRTFCNFHSNYSLPQLRLHVTSLYRHRQPPHLVTLTSTNINIGLVTT